jgi:hypothetical protein
MIIVKKSLYHFSLHTGGKLMLKKIMNRYTVHADLAAYIAEAEHMVSAYGWEDAVTYPYPNCPTKVTKIITDLKDYDRCTPGSQDYLIALANGLADILNAWEKHALEPKVMVQVIKTGKIVKIAENDLDMFDGLVVRI